MPDDKKPPGLGVCSRGRLLLRAPLSASESRRMLSTRQPTAKSRDRSAASFAMSRRVGAAAGATAHKVLYRSTKPDGTPIAVSGIVIVPAGQAPAGGWPIVAWAHPTTGVVPRCAPSLALFVFQQMAGSRHLLENGYAIAADGLSRPRHAWPTPLSGRRQRSARGYRLSTGRPIVSRTGEFYPLCRLGSLAGRSGGPVYRNDCQILCAGVAARRRRCRRAGNGPHRS